MRKISALIVDDERLARDRMYRLLSAQADVTIVGQCATAEQARSHIERNGPDVLFLDIQIPRAGGFELLQMVERDPKRAVVFVTAYEEYAVRAFDVQACDYLLKPVSEERLSIALERTRTFLDHRATDLPSQTDPRMNSILVRVGETIACVPADQIDWIEAAGNYVHLHSDRRAYLVRETMTALEAGLPSHQFARIHRGCIVNVNRVQEFQQALSGDFTVVLKDGQKLRMSRNYRDRIRDVLGHTL